MKKPQEVKMSAAIRSNGVNRVNPGSRRAKVEDDKATSTPAFPSGRWSNLDALKSLTEGARRELTREPGGYVAVARVDYDRRETQIERWRWTGAKAARRRVARLRRSLEGEKDVRGMRVRLYGARGQSLGSALMRPPTGQRPLGRPTGGRGGQDGAPLQTELLDSRRQLAVQAVQIRSMHAMLRALTDRLSDLEARRGPGEPGARIQT